MSKKCSNFAAEFKIITKMKTKQLAKKHRRMVFYAIVCACTLSSCVDKRETITDEYFIHNDSESPVTLQFSQYVAWDTCSDGTFIQVKYDHICEGLPAHKKIRLHPIVREYKMPSLHGIQAGYILGEVTKLIVHTDTVLWYSKYGKMFTNDSIWSIYNTNNWDIVKDQELPQTYYMTFTITEDQLERSIYENK